jgi:hypothetical protein
MIVPTLAFSRAYLFDMKFFPELVDRLPRNAQMSPKGDISFEILLQHEQFWPGCDAGSFHDLMWRGNPQL